jgi:hypothetical protein
MYEIVCQIHTRNIINQTIYKDVLKIPFIYNIKYRELTSDEWNEQTEHTDYTPKRKYHEPEHELRLRCIEIVMEYIEPLESVSQYDEHHYKALKKLLDDKSNFRIEGVNLTWNEVIHSIFNFLSTRGIYHLDTARRNFYFTTCDDVIKLALIDYGQCRLLAHNLDVSDQPYGQRCGYPKNPMEPEEQDDWIRRKGHEFVFKYGGFKRTKRTGHKKSFKRAKRRLHKSSKRKIYSRTRIKYNDLKF